MKIKYGYIILFGILFALIYFFNREYLLQEYQPNRLQISMEVLNPEEDIFQVYFKAANGSFSEKKSEQQEVSGSEFPQKLHFYIPDSAQTAFVRIDFGNRFHTTPIRFNEVSISINGHQKVLENDEIEEYFKPNRYTEYRDGKYIRKIIKDRSDPFLRSVNLEGLIRELQARPDYYRLLINLILSFTLAFSITLGVYHFPGELPGIRKVVSITFIGLFILILLGSHLDLLFDLDHTELKEKRQLAELPEWDQMGLESYPEAFEAYYNDHFGFREILISLNTIIKLKLFRTSPDQNKLIVGKNNWLYYWKEDARNSYLRSNPFNGPSLKRFGKYIERLYTTSKAGGRMFLCATFPNKHSIYEEYIPDRIRCLKQTSPRRMDQAYDFLDEHNIPNLRVEKELLAHKKDYTLYLKHDTHWNIYGAYYAYRKIMDAFAQENPAVAPPLKLSQFNILTDNHHTGGDLLGLVGIDNRKAYFTEPYPRLVPKETKDISRRKNPSRQVWSVYNNRDAGNDLTLLIIGDSYTHELLHLLPWHFKKTIYIWDINASVGQIERMNPDIVLYAIAERNLENF